MPVEDTALEGPMTNRDGGGSGRRAAPRRGAAGERPGLELAGVETEFEGVGAAGQPAWVTRWVGDSRYPFGT